MRSEGGGMMRRRGIRRGGCNRLVRVVVEIWYRQRMELTFSSFGVNFSLFLSIDVDAD